MRIYLMAHARIVRLSFLGAAALLAGTIIFIPVHARLKSVPLHLADPVEDCVSNLWGIGAEIQWDLRLRGQFPRSIAYAFHHPPPGRKPPPMPVCELAGRSGGHPYVYRDQVISTALGRHLRPAPLTVIAYCVNHLAGPRGVYTVLRPVWLATGLPPAEEGRIMAEQGGTVPKAQVRMWHWKGGHWYPPGRTVPRGAAALLQFPGEPWPPPLSP